MPIQTMGKERLSGKKERKKASLVYISINSYMKKHNLFSLSHEFIQKEHLHVYKYLVLPPSIYFKNLYLFFKTYFHNQFRYFKVMKCNLTKQ